MVADGTFYAPGATASTFFGGAVSIYGNYIAISATSFDLPVGVGAVFVFFFNGTSWAFQQRLTAADPGNDLFGLSISLYNNTIVVGAPAATEEYANQGLCLCISRSGTVWTQQAKLVVPKTNAYGNSVSLSGDLLLIGAPDTRHIQPMRYGCHRYIRQGFHL